MAGTERRLRDRSSLALLGAGGLLVVAALVVLLAGLAGLGGDDDGASADSAGAGTVVLDSPRFGLRLRHPPTWRRRPGDRAIRLVSEDRRVGLTITTAASEPATAEVARQLERSVGDAYDAARVVDRGRGRVGGRPARLTAIRARKGREIVDALAIAVASKHRTYAIVAFGSPQAPQPVLREAQAVLASLRFRRPGRR